jgi:hypothetical protein
MAVLMVSLLRSAKHASLDFMLTCVPDHDGGH